MDKNNLKIAFIGGGNMASCIFKSALASVAPACITVSGPHIEKLQHFKEDGAAITTSNVEAAENSNMVFLAVKPQNLTAVLEELVKAKIDFSGKLVISMAAGFKLSSIEKIISSKRLVRIMPNTPAKIGHGATAVSFYDVSETDKSAVYSVLNAMGKSFECSEQGLNVIGAIAGCGPAFVFRFMEAFIHEGIVNGLDAATARGIVEETVLGSALLSCASKDAEISSLREAVTSKGGTTAAGLAKMTEHDFEKTIKDTVKASLDRTYEFEKLY